VVCSDFCSDRLHRYVVDSGGGLFMMIQTQLTSFPSTIIGLGIPGHEDAQHLIVQVIHVCLMAQGRTLCWFACCVATPGCGNFTGSGSIAPSDQQ
jgi:hypothetical protein